jgi:hypothetical protein
MMFDPRAVACALGGDVRGNNVMVPVQDAAFNSIVRSS